MTELEPTPQADLVWGAWQYGGGNGMRIGVQVYGGTGVDTNSTTWSFSNDFWTNNQYNYSGDTQTITYGGNLSGSFNYTNSQATGTSTLRVTKGYTYTYPAGSYGTSPGNLTISGSLSGYYNSMATPSVSTLVAIPARPYAAPNPPTSVVATRNSDTKTTITYANPATAQKPVTNFTIQTRTYTGSTWSAWVTSYTGTAVSVAITTSANHAYQFQVRTNNSVGSSAFVAASATIYTTPSAPTGVAADVSGSDIVITWGSAAYISTTVTHKIERKTDAGAWTSIKTGIAQATKTYTDPSPPGSSNLYRVATVTSSHGGLSSSWVQANVVVLADCWIWDGESELPAMMTQWNGTAELPLTIEQQFVR